MVSLLWIGHPTTNNRIRHSLAQLTSNLGREYARQIKQLNQLSNSPALADALSRTAVQVAGINLEIQRLIRGPASLEPAGMRRQIVEWANQILIVLHNESTDHHAAREGLTHVLELLNGTDAEISSFDAVKPICRVNRILIASEHLFQAQHMLFPAERMLIAAGRQTSQMTQLTALFDVTGMASSGHVRADPTRLARALIAMDLSGTQLVAWLHSHPGQGSQATCPSSTDLVQHADWIRDYSPDLLSIIMVVDGWVRFWGTALESNNLIVDILHPGIVREEKDGWVYRLAE